MKQWRMGRYISFLESGLESASRAYHRVLALSPSSIFCGFIPTTLPGVGYLPVRCWQILPIQIRICTRVTVDTSDDRLGSLLFKRENEGRGIRNVGQKAMQIQPQQQESKLKPDAGRGGRRG